MRRLQALYGRICTGLSRLPAEVDALTLEDAVMLSRYWDGVCPPAHESAARMAVAHGWKPPEAPVEASRASGRAVDPKEAHAALQLAVGGLSGIGTGRRLKIGDSSE